MNRSGTSSMRGVGRTRAVPGHATDRRHRFLALAIIWVLVWRLVIPGFFEYDPDFKGGAQSFSTMVAQEALFNNIIWFSLLGAALYILGYRVRQALQLLRSVNSFLLLLIGFAILSILWSADPSATTARLVHVVIIALDCAALCLAGGWNPRRFQQIVRPILTALVVGSIVFAYLYPDMAITPPVPPDTRHYLHGLASHKNAFGTIVCTAMIFWVHAWLSNETSSLRALLFIIVCGACLLFAHSSTALMASALTGMFMVLLNYAPVILRRYMPYIVGVFAWLVFVYAMAVLRLVPGLDILLVPITALTGKDTTFTDRTVIWDIVKQHISQHPLLGSGYAGYWVGPFPWSDSYIFLSVMYIYPWESHNGYLDIVNDLGYVGIALLVGFVVVYLRQSLRVMRVHRTQAILYLGLIFQGLVSNLSESLWFRPDFWFTIVICAAFAMARNLMDYRAQARSRGPR